jgi:hypothetical protein
LEGLPPFLFVPFLVDGECDPVDGRYLLKNVGATDLHVREIAISGAGFSVGTDAELPLSVSPDHTFSIDLAFQSEKAGEFDANLVVVADEGCVSLPVRGQASGEGGLVRSAYAIDFGDVTADSAGASKSFYLMYQQGTARDANVEFSGFRAEPENVFEVASAPIAEFSRANCLQLEVRIVFHAPSVPGLVEGFYGWDSVATSGGQQLGGLSLINLYGRSIAP